MEPNHSEEYFAAIEAGGTSFSVGIMQGSPTNVVEKFVVDTTTPEETLAPIDEFLSKYPIKSLGIGSFGPVCLDKDDPKYGYITSTPKPHWADTPLVPRFKKLFPEIPVGFDTDVNAAAYAEFKLGNHDCKNSLIYITVGTGVGVGVVANGQVIHGLVHPEGGHLLCRNHPDEPDFKGVCPYHGNCIEGLTANNSVAERVGGSRRDLSNLEDDEKCWKYIGYYLAQLCVNITLIVSPEVIVIGGGIMNRSILYPIIREDFKTLMGGYVKHPKLTTEVDTYIVAPKLTEPGLTGAAVLGREAQVKDSP